MRETLLWILMAVLMLAMFVGGFVVLAWTWSVSGVSRQPYAIFGALALLCAACAVITFNFAHWLNARSDD